MMAMAYRVIFAAIAAMNSLMRPITLIMNEVDASSFIPSDDGEVGGMTCTNEVDASSLLASGGGGEDVEAVCYLCFDGGADEQLRRDCACRGTDAGFVHPSCLTEYLATKSKAWDGRDMNQFMDPWRVCPGCRQDYQNELRIEIATEFVSFVRRQYPDNTNWQVEALHLKLRALMNVFKKLQPVQKEEAGVTADVMLSLIDQMRVDEPPQTYRYSQMKAHAYHVHGRIALDEGTEESQRRAREYFERMLEVCEKNGHDEGIATAKVHMAFAKSKYEGTGNLKEMVKASQEMYKLRIAELGNVHEHTIRAGVIYAINLRRANRGDEARELLTKLLATSKQLYGSEHNITKEVESTLKRVVAKRENANRG